MSRTLVCLCSILVIATPAWANKSTLELETGDVSVFLERSRQEWLSGNWEASHGYAQRALKLDDQNTEALYLVSRFLVFEILGPQDRGETLRRTDDVAGYIETCQSEATGHLVRALGTDPQHRPARLLLGLLYYESERYMRMVGLFEDLRRRTPEDPEPYLMLSLALAAAGNVEHAWGAFSHGLSRLSEGPAYLEAGFSLFSGQQVSLKELVRLWAPDDPFAMTPVNERLMEHYRRVAYANLRFGEPLRGIDGWRTDRGSVYVLYGAPTERTLVENERIPRQEWVYGNVRVSFSSRARDPWVFRSASSGDRAYRRLSDLTEDGQDAAKVRYQWPIYDASARYAQFRGADGKTRVDIHFALPQSSLWNDDGGRGARKVDVTRAITLFSKEWERLSSETTQLERMPRVSGPAGGTLVWTDRIDVLPGRYHLAVEALDVRNGTVGQSKMPFLVRDFKGSEVVLSDVLIGRRIVRKQEGGREGLVVLPTVDHSIPRGKRLSLYLEAYNLQLNDEGESKCHAVFEIWSEDSETWQTVSRVDRRGAAGLETFELDLDLADTLPGKKRIRVTVTDKVADQSAASEADFSVLW